MLSYETGSWLLAGPYVAVTGAVATGAGLGEAVVGAGLEATGLGDAEVAGEEVLLGATFGLGEALETGEADGAGSAVAGAQRFDGLIRLNVQSGAA